MIEFSLSIDLGKEVDRAFIARTLIALASRIQANHDIDGALTDETGLEVGRWRLGLTPPKD